MEEKSAMVINTPHILVGEFGNGFDYMMGFRSLNMLDSHYSCIIVKLSLDKAFSVRRDSILK